MPILPDSFLNPTGKQNAQSSLNEWLKLNVPAGTQFSKYFFIGDAVTAVFPRVEVAETTFPTPGNTAFGTVIRNAGGTGAEAQSEGSKQKLYTEINIFTSDGQKKECYEIRDRIVYALRNAGRTFDLNDGAGDPVEILPPIKVLDYNGSTDDTEIVLRVPVEDDNAITEMYIPPPTEKPEVHQIRLTVDFEWYELN